MCNVPLVIANANVRVRGDNIFVGQLYVSCERPYVQALSRAPLTRSMQDLLKAPVP